MAVRSQLLQQSRKTKRWRKISKSIFIAVLLLIVLGGAVFLLNRPKFIFDQVVVVGAKSTDSANILAVVNEAVSGRYFFLIPKKSIFFWPKEKVLDDLKLAFPRLDQVRPAINDHKLTLQVTEKGSELLWCLVALNNKDCYFIDPVGTAFAKAPAFTEHVLFEVDKEIKASSTAATSSLINQVVVDPIDLSKIFAHKEVIIQAIGEQKFFDRSIITSASVGPGRAYTFTIVSPGAIENSWQLITPVATSSQLAVSLKALFESESFIKNVIKQSDSLDYIDARLLNKLFFKTKVSHATSTRTTP